jgi:hypothetical protein
MNKFANDAGVHRHQAARRSSSHAPEICASAVFDTRARIAGSQLFRLLKGCAGHSPAPRPSYRRVRS